jgi:methyltransferase (TIGR00027 family)
MERRLIGPMNRRIDSITSRTAEMTCMCRAASALESDPFYRSNDHIAPRLLPAWLSLLFRSSFGRHLLIKVFSPRGIYEYVIARTRYMDAAFERTLQEHFDQILIFGAGFDTRALRFQYAILNTRVFELDAPLTQQAKIGQYCKRGLALPSNLTFIAIDFDKDSPATRLTEAGCQRQQRSLFLFEGVLMYLQPVSVDATLRVITDFAGKGSRLVFDYVRASVLRGEGDLYGQQGILQTTWRAGEQWYFGMEPEQLQSFLAGYGMQLVDNMDSQELKSMYFTDQDGRLVGRINATHCLATAEV